MLIDLGTDEGPSNAVVLHEGRRLCCFSGELLEVLTIQNRQAVLSDGRTNIWRRCGSYGSGGRCPAIVRTHHRYVVHSLFRGAIPTDLLNSSH